MPKQELGLHWRLSIVKAILCCATDVFHKALTSDYDSDTHKKYR